MLQIALKPLIKLFQSHAVYDGTEICYRDFIQKSENWAFEGKSSKYRPPPETQEKSICCDNEAASISLKGQVARSSRKSVAPVQWSLSVPCQKSKPREVLKSFTSFNVSNSFPGIESSYLDITWISDDYFESFLHAQ